MRFDLVDRVIEQAQDRIVTVKAITNAEEYLADHFPTFPVLPGVLMLEAMVQAARRLADSSRADQSLPLALSKVRALKYGRFVRPGDVLHVEVTLASSAEDSWDFKGQVTCVPPTPPAANAPGEPAFSSAASGRFTLRPASFADTTQTA